MSLSVGQACSCVHLSKQKCGAVCADACSGQFLEVASNPKGKASKKVLALQWRKGGGTLQMRKKDISGCDILYEQVGGRDPQSVLLQCREGLRLRDSHWLRTPSFTNRVFMLARAESQS